ncbi:DNA-3-methyladenine glycosylase family protein [Pseudomonas sp. Marseille-QA0892]
MTPNRFVLPYTPPFHWAQFQAFFALRLLPGVEALDERGYRRIYRRQEGAGWFEVSPAIERSELVLTVYGAETDNQWLRTHVRHMFDLDVDPDVIQRHFERDDTMGPLVKRSPGLRLPAAFDPFEQAVRAIVGQQISVKAAVTITGRIVERLGEHVDSPQGMPHRLFPTASQIADGDLSSIGMPQKRADALQRFARGIAEGTLDLSIDDTADALVERLCQLQGIGPWTAQYIALRAFGAKDAFPVSDLGLLKAPVWGDGGIDARSLADHAESWRPYRAYAAIHLWQNYTPVPLGSASVQ